MSATPPHLTELPEELTKARDRALTIVRVLMERLHGGDKSGFSPLSGKSILRQIENAARFASANPDWLAQLNADILMGNARIWQYAAERLRGIDNDPPVKPDPADKRFKDDDWTGKLAYDVIKQSYLETSRRVLEAVGSIPVEDDKAARQRDFYAQLLLDMLAPTNFPFTNPRVVRETMETNGANLVKGLNHFLEDLEAGNGRLRIRMTDAGKFALGENVATTPGQVVYQNDLMQLIQYTPTTDAVYKRPLMIIPPWINKFYILDLRPKNSFIKWAVDQGHTVFIISWVNPDESLAHKTFEDYLVEGPLAALDAIAAATGEKTVKAIGYCLGGTLLSAALAHLNARKDPRIRAATFFTTMTDFSDPGELGVFIDEEQIARTESKMNERGYLDGAQMANAFNLLRANDLIWGFVINNYLMGKEPFPFDLLFWNSDSTRMPSTMHAYYLRNMYLNNKLAEPNALTLNGTPIDLTGVATPSYVVSTREDHIAPWRSTYATTQLFKGPMKFVLGGSGHIAGIVNPPAANKYGYWTGGQLPTDPTEWLEQATYHQGSWWPDWQRWTSRYNGGRRIAARQPGDGDLEVIEEAPGSYVKQRNE